MPTFDFCIFHHVDLPLLWLPLSSSEGLASGRLGSRGSGVTCGRASAAQQLASNLSQSSRLW